MDKLSALVDTLAVGGLVYCRIEASAPWGMSAEPDKVASFHALRQGNAVLRVDGEPGPVMLEAGDVVVVSHGTGHAIVDKPETRSVRFVDELARRGLSPAGVLSTGGGGACAALVCGAFLSVPSPERPPILALLPRVLVLRAAPEAGSDEPARARRARIGATLADIERELAAQEPGGGAVISRLTSVLFVQLLREWIEQHPAGRDAMLGAMTDPAIGRAMALVHQSPEDPWSVATLARRVGMSRSAFATRFRSLVGETPIRHVARMRLQRAAVLLRSESDGVAQVARRLGYDSEAAFSRAFKRHFGASPSDYRVQLPSA